MGSDDHLLIPPEPKPEATEPRPHRLAIWLSGAALAVAVLAAFAALYEAIESGNARTAADRSAKAAEESAAEAKALNKMTQESLAIAKASADAAEKAASAADRQAQAAVEQLRLTAVGNETARGANEIAVESLRARITALGVTLRKRPTAGESMTADAFIQNTGQSEAVNVRATVQMLVAAELPQGAMPNIAPPNNASAGVLAPQGKMSTDLTASALDATTVTALTTRKARVFVYGVVTYDTFGASHETRFCYIPDPVNITNAQTCAKWNEAR